VTQRFVRSSPAWFGLLAVAAVAVNLRPGATSIGPALPELRDELAMSSTVAGALTALPGLCFAVVGALAVGLAVRLGLNAALACGLVAIVVGLGARVLVADTVPFLLLSAVGLAGAAVGNILVPAFVKRHYPNRVGGLMGVYTVGLSIGATTPGIIHPYLRTVGGWRLSLGVWAGVAGVALIAWLMLAATERRHRSTNPHTVATSVWSVARSPKAIALAVFFGAQSMQAYIGFGWIPQLLVDGGTPMTTASFALALYSGWGILASAVTPWLAGRFPDRRPLVVLFTALLVAGWLGILIAPAAAPYVWVSLLALAGTAFPLILVMITDLTRNPHVTSALSGFSQSVGYVFSSAGPFLIGWLHAVTDGWRVPIWFLLLSAIPFLVSGWIAGKPGYVDDELPQ
jgi:CP family cyanate transporter-like MFS transporter